jgi:two-component system sensor histidine kinase KdpD
MARGLMRIYLGAAPGVGKTFTMLDEGYRRRERGTDVVIGYVETHRRPKTEQQVRDLEIVPRRPVTHRGQVFEEMDVDAIIARHPQVALVDELAHTNVPGSRNAKRWQDIDELLAAGIDVISTVNIQHLESLNDVVEEITGITQRETVPDAFVRQADQIELVDMTPEALRRRMAHGNIYAPDKVDAALGNYFRTGNLTALRELALLWVADQVDSAMHDYRARHGIAQPWETRERVAVALTGAPGGDDLIRRASRIARRSKAELIGIHVESSDGLAGADRADLEEHRRLLTDLGGTYREVVDADVGKALVRTAIVENATQLVIGASRRSRWSELMGGSVVNAISKHAGEDLDIHIIASHRSATDSPPRPPRRARLRISRLSRRRQQAGLAGALIGLPVLTAVLEPLRDRLGFTSIGFCYLLAVVAIGAVGGAAVAIVAAVAAFLFLNWFFADPVHTFTIANERDAIALIVFLLVAAVVSLLVERAARRSADARKARGEAEVLAGMAGILLRDDDPLTDIVGVLASTFALEGVSVLRSEAGAWHAEATAGPRPPTTPADATFVLPLAPDVQLALVGGELTHDDRRILDTFTTQVTIALEGRRLRAEAALSAALSKANDLRTTLLAAVSHDLRTPLTTIKTSASSLLDDEVVLDEATRHELLETIDSESDRLNILVGNLLDLGRLEADVVTVTERATDVSDVLAGAIANTAPQTPSANGSARLERLVLQLPDEDLPPVRADPVLLERAVVNLAANALRYSPTDQAVGLRAVAVDGTVEIRIIDHGPGIPRTQRAQAFLPFQRLGDRPETAGVGLGLAVARGFIEAMDGKLSVDETPGGGTTMVIALRAWPPASDPAREPRPIASTTAPATGTNPR